MPALYVISGVILGSIITWYARDFEISRALDTIGIKRKEFSALKKDHDATKLELSALKERVSQIVDHLS